MMTMTTKGPSYSATTTSVSSPYMMKPSTLPQGNLRNNNKRRRRQRRRHRPLFHILIRNLSLCLMSFTLTYYCLSFLSSPSSSSSSSTTTTTTNQWMLSADVHHHYDDQMLLPTTKTRTNFKETPLKNKRQSSPPFQQKQQQQREKSIILNNDDKVMVDIPAVVVPTHLDIKCTRHYYCNPSNCQPLHIDMSNYTTANNNGNSNILPQSDGSSSYDQIRNDFFNVGNTNTASSRAEATKRKDSSSSLKIQYWGDSIQATLDCDMRQWIYENSKQQQQQTIQSEYVQVGCPWYCDVQDKKRKGNNRKKKNNNKKEEEEEGTTTNTTVKQQQQRSLLGLNFLRIYAKQADVIVFNIGGHYEIGSNGPTNFLVDIEDRYYNIFINFLSNPNKLLIIRSPSPTNFDTSDGLFWNETQHEYLKNKYKQNNMSYGCTELLKRNIPNVIQQQDTSLKNLVQRLILSNTTSVSSHVEYLDIYELSRPRYMEHAHIPGNLDCKHYCQNCGLLRSWNLLIANIILNSRILLLRR